MEIVFVLAIVVFIVYGYRKSKSIEIKRESRRISQRFMQHLLSADIMGIEDPFDRYVQVVDRTMVSCFGQVRASHLSTAFFPKSVLYHTISVTGCLSNFGVIYNLIFMTLDPPDRLASTISEVVSSELDKIPSLSDSQYFY